MNLAEEIKAWQLKRAEQVTIMSAVLAASKADGDRTMTDEESKKFDAAEAQLVVIDSQIRRITAMEKAVATTALEVTPTGLAPVADPNDKGALRNKAPATIKRDADEKFAGQNFVRMTLARTLAAIDGIPAHVIAHKRWGRTNPTIVELLQKANEIPSQGSAAGDYGAELVTADTRYTGDFINFLYAATIYNKLPLREVPANVQIKGQDGAAGAAWVGEGRGIPVTVQDFLAVNLTPLKVAAIAVMSNEWLRDSSPSAELLIRDGLVQAGAQRIDTTFFSGAAAVSGVSPAGIFNGVTALASSGTLADSVRDDAKRIVDIFVQARNAGGLWWAMSPSLATALEFMVNGFSSNREFPGVSSDTGGTFLSKPVALGENIGTDVLALLKPSDIYKIGEMGVRVELSREATIEMSAAPTQDAGSLPPTASTGVSMFGTDSIAMKVVMAINFAKRRSHAAQFIQDAQYGELNTVTA